ncbi:hypothetical protein Aperf_G00000058471 [Anoplocephala perfoliata]
MSEEPHFHQLSEDLELCAIQFEEALRRFADSFSPNPSTRINSFLLSELQSSSTLSRPAESSSSTTADSATNENEDDRSDCSSSSSGSDLLPHSPLPPNIPSIQILLTNLASLRKDLAAAETTTSTITQCFPCLLLVFRASSAFVRSLLLLTLLLLLLMGSTRPFSRPPTCERPNSKTEKRASDNVKLCVTKYISFLLFFDCGGCRERVMLTD